jgi:TIR domain
MLPINSHSDFSSLFGGPIEGLRIEYVSSCDLSDLFISYSSETEPLVSTVLAALRGDEAANHQSSPRFTLRVFKDSEGIASGQLWDAALTEAIFKTRVLVPFLCDAYLHSQICMFELMLFLQRDHISYVVREGSEAKQYFPGSALAPYQSSLCQIPAIIQRFHAPLIPSSRPLPEDFLRRMRADLINAVQNTKVEYTMSSKPILTPEYRLGRDLSSLQYPNYAAELVLSASRAFLEEGVPDDECRKAIYAVASGTREFLTRSS